MRPMSSVGLYLQASEIHALQRRGAVVILRPHRSRRLVRAGDVLCVHEGVYVDTRGCLPEFTSVRDEDFRMRSVAYAADGLGAAGTAALEDGDIRFLPSSPRWACRERARVVSVRLEADLGLPKVRAASSGLRVHSPWRWRVSLAREAP